MDPTGCAPGESKEGGSNNACPVGNTAVRNSAKFKGVSYGAPRNQPSTPPNAHKHDDDLCASDAISIQTPLVKMPPGMQQSYKGGMTGMTGPAVGAAELLYYRACASLMDASAAEEHRRWHERHGPTE